MSKSEGNYHISENIESTKKADYNLEMPRQGKVHIVIINSIILLIKKFTKKAANYFKGVRRLSTLSCYCHVSWDKPVSYKAFHSYTICEKSKLYWGNFQNFDRYEPTDRFSQLFNTSKIMTQVTGAVQILCLYCSTLVK